MTTNEGGTIDDENLANYANDRVTTLSWVYLGLTMNCSACHDHKFDPLTQRDYYGLMSAFNQVSENGLAGGGPGPMSTPVPSLPAGPPSEASPAATPCVM